MGKNRTDCPRCGAILQYDQEHDVLLCPQCGHVERVQNDINIDSHNQIINNYYAGPSEEKTDNRGSYEQMVQRIIAFVEDNDTIDRIAGTLGEIRNSYPQTYYGQLVKIWSEEECIEWIFAGKLLYGNLFGMQKYVKSQLDVNDPNYEDDDDNITLEEAVGYVAYLQLKDKGLTSTSLPTYTKQSGFHAYYNTIRNLESVLTTIKDKLSGYAKYQFEKEHYDYVLKSLDLVKAMLRNFSDLADNIYDYVEGNIDRVREVVNMRNVSTTKSINSTKPTKKSAGVVSGVFMAIFELFALILFIMALSDQRNFLEGAMLVIGLDGVAHFSAYCVNTKHDYSSFRSFYKWVQIIGFALAFIFLIVLAASQNPISVGGGAAFAIITFVPFLIGIILTVIRLPKQFREQKEIKRRNQDYRSSKAANNNKYQRDLSSATYETVADMCYDYRYDFSRWR